MSTKQPESARDESTDEQPVKKSIGLIVYWRRYQRLLVTRWWVLVLMVGLCLSIAGWYSASKPPKFASVSRMMISIQISLPGTAIYSEEAQNFFGTQISLMESQMVRSAAEARVRSMRPELTPCPAAINVSQLPRTSIFMLQATGDQPEYTQALLDAVMQEYMNTKKEMRSEKSNTTVSAIAEELEILEKKIKAGEDELVNFQKENNINFLQAEGNSAGLYLSGIDRKLADLNTEYQLLNLLSLDQNIDRKRADASSPPAASSSPSDAPLAGFGAQGDYSRAKQQIELLKAQLADYLVYLKPKHPIIAHLNDEISLQQKLIAVYQEQSKTQLEGERESKRIQIENLQNERKEWSAKALDLSGRSGQYDALKSKLDRLKGLYDRLLTSMQAIDVNKNLDQNIVAILEKASPSVPLKLGLFDSLVSAVLTGLGLGLAILFLCDKLDDRIISSEEYCALFDERILGRIPVEKTKILALLHPADPAFAEAFSSVRSALLFNPGETDRARTILVASAVPNEGKSTIAANLAATLAYGGARTLLVDGDLRRGDIHKVLDIPNDGGVAEIIAGEVEWSKVAKPCKIDNLTVITRGKALESPGKYLLGSVTGDFLKQIGETFDFVILDSAPVLAVDDTTMLAPKVDAVLNVIRLGFSSFKSVRAAQELLHERDVKIIGTVLNALDASIDGYTYYRYSSYYSHIAKS